MEGFSSAAGGGAVGESTYAGSAGVSPSGSEYGLRNAGTEAEVARPGGGGGTAVAALRGEGETRRFFEGTYADGSGRGYGAWWRGGGEGGGCAAGGARRPSLMTIPAWSRPELAPTPLNTSTPESRVQSPESRAVPFFNSTWNSLD